MAMSTYIKKQASNVLMLYLKLLEKQEQAKPKTSRREVIKIRPKINETETKKYKESIKQEAGSLKK
jgi:hypothetical protein